MEQNGIDILCDAAGSDLLLGTFLPPSSPPAQPRTKRTKHDEDAAANAQHVCHICRRVYERADHLTRHLRSHENARPYQCTLCPKRFNRADLLTRHATTHERDDGLKGKTIIRRSDRAAEACQNCASSKAKCDDQKPCGRCRSKNLDCETAPKRAGLYRTSDAISLQGDDTKDSTLVLSERTMRYPPSQEMPLGHGVNGATSNAEYSVEVHSLLETTPDDMFYLNPDHNFFQNMDFANPWDLNFDNFTIPQIGFQGPSPQSTTTSNSRQAVRDPTRGYAAFKRSPWLWEPRTKDTVGNNQECLTFNEKSIAHSPAYERALSSTSSRLKMEPAKRDELFALVLAQRKDPSKIPSFPSIDLLNYLLQTYFVQDNYQTDSWIHSASLDCSKTLPELLAGLVASGAGFIAEPAVWQFGLALQEIVRISLASLFENSNVRTRDLECLQTFLLQLEIGLWSGFKRKMEIAESFLQPPLTMLRRGRAFFTSADSSSIIPTTSDSSEELEIKWRKFVKEESYKRFAVHLFFHSVQASVAFQHNPLMSCTELSFALPAARELWRAPNAEAWREVFLRTKQPDPDAPPPLASEIMSCITVLDAFEGSADIELCYATVLYGFWGQIAAYREAVKFYHNSAPISSHRNSTITHRLWLNSQHQELYRDLSEFSTLLGSSKKLATQLSLVAELFMMILHVCPDELQRFAGKQGEDEARRAATSLEQNWAGSREARHAAWHAGQVIRNARMLPPASLRGFNAIAVYFASLTLWIFGLLSCSNTADMKMVATQVLVDGIESRETRAFLQLDKGTPGITLTGDVRAGVELLSNPGMVLNIASNVFRDNFPVRTEPLPALVESLRNLLRDLGTGPAGRPSRVPSRAASEDS